MPQKVGTFSLRPSSTAIWRCSRLSGVLLSSYGSPLALTPILNYHISPSTPVARHSCHPPNPHFVTLPILISFSHVFLLVFLISIFMIFLKAYFSVVLTISSVFADAWQWDRLQLLWLFQELPQNSVAGGRKKPRIIFLVKLLCIFWWTGAMNNSFPSSTDSCHQTKPGHVVLKPQSAVGLRLENWRVLRLIYSRSLYQIFASSHIVFLFHQNW